jgi:hypothetical protein
MWRMARKCSDIIGRQMIKTTMRQAHLDGQEKVEALNLLDRRNWQQFATDSATFELTLLMYRRKPLAN